MKNEELLEEELEFDAWLESMEDQRSMSEYTDQELAELFDEVENEQLRR